MLIIVVFRKQGQCPLEAIISNTQICVRVIYKQRGWSGLPCTMSGRCVMCTEDNAYVEEGQTASVHGKGVHLMCTWEGGTSDVYMRRGYI